MGFEGEMELLGPVFGVAVGVLFAFVASAAAEVEDGFMTAAFESFRSRCSAPCRSSDSWIFFIHSFATSSDSAAKNADFVV